MKSNKTSPITCAMVLALGVTIGSVATNALQSHTSGMVLEILDPYTSACPHHTQLYYPPSYPHIDILRQFKTCSVPLSLTVLPDGRVLIGDTGGYAVGYLNTHTRSIENIQK